MLAHDPVVVTGIGIVSPLGTSRDEFRDHLLSGACGIAPVTGFDVSACRSQLAAQTTGFDATRWVSPMKLRRMDRTGAYAVIATREALEHAGRSLEAADDRTGVVMGTYTAGGQASSDYLDALHAGGATGAPALLFSSTVGNAPASLAALEFKLRGPNMTVSQKEASGVGAIVYGRDLLAQGRADAIAAGGIDAIYDVFFRVHDRFKVMADRQWSTADGGGPFDRSRRGYLMGEGGYVLLLEPASVAAARGAHTLGEVAGTGASSSAVSVNQWPDRPEAVARTMRLAIADAGLSANEIDVVYAAANASQAVDRVEADALRDVFGPDARPVVTSIKGAVGESGAAGAAACAAALLCGRAGAVPGIVGLAEPDQITHGLRLATVSQPAPGPLVLVNSIGSGGSLFSLVLRVHTP